jgi:hypothetical protein
MDSVEFLAQRVNQINSNISTVLSTYMTWYTFYWILNGSVLAWKFNSSDGISMPTPLAVGFFVMSLPAMASSFVVVCALHSMIKLGRQISLHITDDLDRSVARDGDTSVVHAPAKSLVSRSVWPVKSMWWGLSVNGVATLGLSILWIWIAMSSSADPIP